MQPWSRQPCLIYFVPLLLALLHSDHSRLLAQQPSGTPSKPNALRLGRPSTFEMMEPPAFRSEPLGPLTQEPKTKKEDLDILIIGSASTILVKAGESDSLIFADELNEEVIDPSIVLEIAIASMSHASPFCWWMAGPTSNLFRTHESPTDPDITSDEPPRMADEDNETDNQTVSMDVSDAKSDLEKQVQLEPIELDGGASKMVRKPAPRPLKIPFEEQVVESAKPLNSPIIPPASDASKNQSRTVARNSDSQREQEEPQLDPVTRPSGRELQGIDAMNASKPVAHRREIRIDDASDSKEVPPIVQRPSADPVLAMRLKRTDACLRFYLENPESTSIRSPWAVMHALLAFGAEYEMVHGQGRVNAIGWMCHNGTCRTQRMFTPKGKGFVPNVGGGVQGHEGQFLAILAQSNVPLDYPIQIGSAMYKVEDLVRYEMATCKERSELTFKLIGLSYYLDSNKQWKANDGRIWSIPKLIQEELAQPINGSACGGTHRLMGFSFSVRQRQLQGQPIDGQYARAAKFVRDYVAYTWQLQNPDGSFSTNWYEGRSNEPNDERKVQTSGHMLEWLMFTMSDDELKSPKVAKGIDFLLSKIYDQRDNKWPIGPRGHATRAVGLYNARIKEILNQTSETAPSQSASKTTPAPIIRK
ncbi:MAG: hypothetical protein NTU79_23090 [Planctomycetota bacterium]|nr:hypothetical protein [Planctomycetota bacterium]